MTGQVDPGISIFGGEYNAKTKTRRQIAEQFVAPKSIFGRLIRPDNAVLIGPRGSGKTTLLTMLEGRALEIWPEPEAELTRRRVDYTGVFVACDRAWAEQLRSLADDGPVALRFSTALFVLHTLRALVGTGAERLETPAGTVRHRRPDPISPMALATLAQRTADAWQLPDIVSDLRDLEDAITDHIIRLQILHSQLGLEPAETRQHLVAAEPLLHLSLVDAALSFVGRYNRAVHEPEGRWALMFDELELAPPHLLDMVLQRMRGTDRRLLFKVSYAPYEGWLGGPHGPQEAQDYSVIRLSYANKDKGFDFSRRLLQRRLDEAGGSLSPEEALGKTGAIEDDDHAPPPPANSYAPGSAAVVTLLAAAEADSYFAAWLKRNRIDLLNLEHEPDHVRSKVRKILPMMELRIRLRRLEREAGTAALRAIQLLDAYSGERAFLAMTEGNPRWLEHICDRLLADWDRKPIPEIVQARVLRAAGEEFLSYLHILPVRGTHLGVDEAPRQLLDKIGAYLRHAQLAGRFSSDPPGSIRIDERASPAHLAAVQALVDRGALIEVPETDLPSVGPLTGRRYRIAYLLAPHFHLPLRLDKAINLTTVLRRARNTQQLEMSNETSL